MRIYKILGKDQWIDLDQITSIKEPMFDINSGPYSGTYMNIKYQIFCKDQQVFDVVYYWVPFIEQYTREYVKGGTFLEWNYTLNPTFRQELADKFKLNGIHPTVDDDGECKDWNSATVSCKLLIDAWKEGYES